MIIALHAPKPRSRQTTRRLTRWLVLLPLLIAGAVANADPAATEPRPYVLSVIPRLTPAHTYRLWNPFVERLSRETGAPIKLRLFQNLTEFETELAKGTLDFVYLSPYHQIMARRQQGYIPLVRDNRLLEGLLLVRADGPIHNLKDLNGKDIVFPHPNAFGASLYIRALLHERFGIRFTPRYQTNHSNVYRHVVGGQAAAGGGVNHSLILEPDSLRKKLRVLYSTPGTASHPLSAHPRVPPALRQAVTRAVLHMNDDDAGRLLLRNVVLSNPEIANHARDYAPLEQLKLEKYYVRVKQGGP